MAETDRAFVREFLYKIIDDTQGTIRSLDAKAAVGIAILGAMVGQVIGRSYFEATRHTGPFSTTVFFLFATLATIAACLGFKTVFPMIDPSKNVTFANDLRPPFFIHRFAVKRWPSALLSHRAFARLAETHDSYCKAIDSASPADVERILAAEVLKLSFIRQMKHNRLAAFSIALIVAVVLFVTLVYSIPNLPSAR